MHHFFFDASAFVKRYHQEPGSEVVNYLLDSLLDSAPARAIISSLILSETVSVLSREHNARRIPAELFQRASARLLFEARTVSQQPVDDETILESIPLINRHNLNASDALFLRQALNLGTLLQDLEHDLVVVASDRRLLRATAAEGLSAINPEESSLKDARALLQI
jgi:predicted nucleic acid-binding protein